MGRGEPARRARRRGAEGHADHRARNTEPCAKDPIGCAAQAISLGQAFDPGKAFDLADRPAMSQDTLQPGDRTPGWRGPATVTAARR